MGAITAKATYKWLAEREITTISDEIYHDLVYTSEPQFSGLVVSDEAVVIDGFFKR